MGLRSVGNGWLPVDGARWYGMWGGGAGGGGGVLLLESGVAGVRAPLPAGPWGCTVVCMSSALLAGVVGGGGSRGGGVEGVLVVCGTPASAGAVVGMV